ncbi:MAG: ABC transporter permease [Anaerolineae bacterium]
MRERITRNLWPLVPILMSILATTLLLVLVGGSPALTFSALFDGAIGTSDRLLSTMAFWVPLLLCASGLLVTFTAGLWNIGVEGQMIMGALGSSWVALKVAAVYPAIPGWIILIMEIVAAMVFGALWSVLAGILKTRGGVHEIFGGVALNNLAIIATNYLISGPWQPPEGGTFRGTQPFPSHALFPLLGDSRFSPLTLVLALVVLGLVALSLRGTSWGLRLKALGKNPRSAFLLGVPSERETLTAMLVCGAAAGLAGSVRVLSWFDSLRQSISGGIGFLAILIVLLGGMRPLWTLLIALLFSALLTGGTTVQLRTQLKASLSGIIQGTLVLFVLLFGDYRILFRKRRKEPQAEANEP